MTDHDGREGRPPRDAFDEGRRLTEGLRDELASVREDVRAIVQEEVRSAGVPRSALDRMILDAVREELPRLTPAVPRWIAPTLVAVAIVAVLALVGVGWMVVSRPADRGATGPAPQLATPDDAAGDASGTETPSGAETQPVSEPEPPPSPEERAATFDSLLAARSARLDTAITLLESAAPTAGVLRAITAWRGVAALPEADASRLHDGLLQLALNDLGGAGLVLDGLVTRGPCGGSSCGALLTLWQARGAELGLPAYPADPANDADALEVAEGALLLTWLESIAP